MKQTINRLSTEGITHAIESEYNQYDFSPDRIWCVENLDMKHSKQGFINLTIGDQHFDARLTPGGRYKKNSLRVNHNAYQTGGE